MYISVTAFKPVGLWPKILFQMHAAASFLQANKAPGLIKAQTFKPEQGIHSTLSFWDSKEAMLAYRNSGSHLKAMKASGKLGKGITAGWESDQAVSTEFAYQRLVSLKGNLHLSDEIENRLVRR